MALDHSLYVRGSLCGVSTEDAAWRYRGRYVKRMYFEAHYPEIVRVRGDPMAEKYPLYGEHDVLPIRDSTKGPRGSCTFSDGKTHLGKDRISLCPLDRSGWMMEPSQPQNETSILDLPPQCSGRRISLRGKVQLWKVESLSTKIKA